jgi:hypothetical protein
MSNHIDGAPIEVEPRHEKSWRVKTTTRQLHDAASRRAGGAGGSEPPPVRSSYFGMAQLLAPAAGR